MLVFLFGRLAVGDEGEHLALRFGPVPLFSKVIPYARITAVEEDRSHWLSGWGIHFTRKGWLWNIGGFDCVRVEMDRKTVLVGTDEPDRLASFLRSKIVSADRRA